MIELIKDYLLKDWHKQSEILTELFKQGITINDRQWRIEVNRHNDLFKNHEVDFYITHSNCKGYKATRDYTEALVGRNDYLSRALDMLKKVKDCDKGFNTKDNLRFDLEKEEII